MCLDTQLRRSQSYGHTNWGKTLLRVLDNEDPVYAQDVAGLLLELQAVLNLHHWRIKHKLMSDDAMQKSLMRIVPTRDRQCATIYIRQSLLGSPTKKFGPLLLHELLHLVLDPIMEEYEYQSLYEMPPTRATEYQRRLTRCLERTVEHLTHSVAALLKIDTEEED